MMRIWTKMSDEEKAEMSIHKWTLATQIPDPTAEATPYVDPCQNAEDMRACYVSALQTYGVDVMNQEDTTTYEGDLGRITLEEFSNEQLAIVLEGVQKTGQYLTPYVGNALGIAPELLYHVTPEQAFTYVFGNVEFGYVPSLTWAKTVTSEDQSPTDLANPIYILLTDSSFAVGRGFHPSFVTAHELGHAFHNRYGGDDGTGVEPIAGTLFVEATGSEWNISQNRYFGYGFLGPEVAYFPNETEFHPGPSEGFSDTFSNMVLNPAVVPFGTTRRQYFEQNMPQWVIDIVCRNGGCYE
jgi:hypothetical protein